MSGRLVNRMLGKKASRRHKNLVREAVELKAKVAQLEDREQDGEAEAARGSNAVCDDSGDEAEDDDGGEPEAVGGAAAASAGSTSTSSKSKGHKAALITCFDASGRQVDLTQLAIALSGMKQFMEATKINQEGSSQSQRSSACKVMSEVGDKIFKSLQQFIDAFTKEKSQMTTEFFMRLSMSSNSLRNPPPSAPETKMAKKLRRKYDSVSGGDIASAETRATMTAESATQTDGPVAEPSKIGTLRSISRSSLEATLPPPLPTTSTSSEMSLSQSEDTICDLQSEVSVLKDKLVQSMNSSTAEISELRTELDRAKKCEGELEEQLRKAQVGKNEVQRLRSSLGEAEQRSKQSEKAMAQMTEEMGTIKSKLAAEQQWSEGKRESARNQVLKVQIESLQNATQIEIRTSEQYIRGLQHLLLLTKRRPQESIPMIPSLALEQHVGLYIDFKIKLQKFLHSCKEIGHEINGESESSVDIGDLWSFFSNLVDNKRPTALSSSTLELIAPALASIVGNNAAAGTRPPATFNPPPPQNGRCSNIVAVAPPLLQPLIRQEARNSTSSVSRQSLQYQELVGHIKRALPRLSTDECFRHLSVLKQANSGRLSGLSIPYIIREIARRLPPTSADDEEGGGRGNDGYLKWVGVPGRGRGGNFEAYNGDDDDRGRMVNYGSSGSSSSDGNNMEECCICLGPLSEEPVTRLDCIHTFHTECIRDWLKEKRECPFCRSLSVMPDEYPELH